MTLNGSAFAFFFVAVFVIHWALPRRAQVQNAVLLAASYAFYFFLRISLLPVLVVSTWVDYFIGLALGSEVRSAAARLRLLWLSITFNVGLLAWFKYVGFLAEPVAALLGGLGIAVRPEALQIALPVGISYYTLMKIGYVVDVYYRRIEPCRDLVRFSVFSGFFAQILAGPVGRAGHLLPQYAVARQLAPEMLGRAAATFLLGFALKAYVGEILAIKFVTPLLSEPAAYGALGHWLGLGSYCLQLFSDFAGYSLMAIGVGRAFGIELPRNFDVPFLAVGMMDFWRRWHISLNTWLFDYIYNPLVTGTGPLRGLLATGFLVVFLISGAWHGATWGFVLWGFLQGLGLAVQHRWDQFYKGLCRKDRVWVARRRSKTYLFGAWLVTQAYFLLTLVPFRFGSLPDGWAFLQGLFGGSGRAPSVEKVPLLLAGLVLLGLHLAETPWGREAKERFFRLPHPVRGAAYGAAIVLLAIFVPAGSGTFIYANF